MVFPRELIFRPAQDGDLPAVDEFLRESTSGVLHAAWGDGGVRKQLEVRGPTGIQSCTVVDYGGIIIGHQISYPDAARSSEEPLQLAAASLLAPFRRLRMPGAWYLSSIAVSLDYRRRGLGSNLLRASASLAAKAGCAYLSLHVFEEKQAAMRLYSSAGLREAGRTKLPAHSGVTATSDLLLMVGAVSNILNYQQHFDFDWGSSI